MVLEKDHVPEVSWADPLVDACNSDADIPGLAELDELAHHVVDAPPGGVDRAMIAGLLAGKWRLTSKLTSLDEWATGTAT